MRGLLFWGGLALALSCFTEFAEAKIRDRSKTISPRVLKRIRSEVREVRRLYQTHIEIDIYNKSPIPLPPGVQNHPEFGNWLKNKAQKAGKKTVYTLAILNPPYLMISVGDLIRERAVFQTRDRNRLMHLLATRFRQTQIERGLLEGIAFIRNTLSNRMDGTDIPTIPASQIQAALNAQAAPKKDSKDSYLNWVGLILVGIFGAWLLFNVFQTITALKRKPENEPVAQT